MDFESEEEAESFVNYAAILGDDGESATCALAKPAAGIAVHRGWAIATDDRRAISFVQQEAPSLQVLSTPEIIKHWSEETGLDLLILRDVINAIQVKGRYFPPKSHPLHGWWKTASNFET